MLVTDFLLLQFLTDPFFLADIEPWNLDQEHKSYILQTRQLETSKDMAMCENEHLSLQRCGISQKDSPEFTLLRNI